MTIKTESLTIQSQGRSEVIDITDLVSALFKNNQMDEGQALIFVAGSTASVTTTEFERGLQKDIPLALERMAPSDIRYHHDETWHDGNGHSHVRAAIMGCSLTIPFSHGELLLGTWQQIVLVDHDNRARSRQVIVQFIGTTRA